MKNNLKFNETPFSSTLRKNPLGNPIKLDSVLKNRSPKAEMSFEE